MAELVSELLDIPWFRTGLLIVLAFSTLVLVLMVPMYFVVWPLLRRLRAELATFTSGLALSLEAHRRARAKELADRGDDYLDDSQLQRAFSSGTQRERWAAIRALKRLRKPVKRAAKALADARADVATLCERLRRTDIGGPSPLPDAPAAAEIVDSHAGYRRAWFRLVAATVLLLGLMTVNTALASTILPAIGVVSPSVTFAGIRLAVIIAFLLASTEAGIGLCHAGTKEPESFTVWPAVFLILALPIAMFDGWAFSRIAQEQDTFLIPLLGYEMRQADLFFLFGFVITWTLFGLGALAYEAGASVLGGRSSDLLSRAMRRLRRSHDHYSKAVRQGIGVLQEAAPAVGKAESILNGPGGEHVAGALEALRQELEGTTRASAPAPGASRSTLTRTEVWQLANYAGIWFLGALAGAIAMIAVALNNVSGSVASPFGWGLATGQVLVCLAVGSLLYAGESLVLRRGSGEGHQSILSGSWLSQVAALAIGGGLIAFFLFLAYAVNQRWLINVIIGLFLAVAGYVLVPLLGVLSLWFSKLWLAVRAVAAAMLLFLVRVVKGMVIVMETIARMFAEPLDRVFGRRGAPPPESPMASVERLSRGA